MSHSAAVQTCVVDQMSWHGLQVSDARLTFSTLIAGMKTLCYSIYNYGNTARPIVGQHNQHTVQVSGVPLPGTHQCSHKLSKTPNQTILHLVTAKFSAAQPPTLGLRENEMRLATRMIKRGLPCLQLFGERTADVRLSDRNADIYDSYADMFTVLAVRLSLPLHYIM